MWEIGDGDGSECSISRELLGVISAAEDCEDLISSGSEERRGEGVDGLKAENGVISMPGRNGEDAGNVRGSSTGRGS